MSIQQAQVRLGITGVDKVSPMLDRVGSKVGVVQNKFQAVGTSARQAMQKVKGLSSGFTDLRSAGMVVFGLAQSVQQFTESIRESAIAGEKAINVTRALQMMMGDTSQAVRDATTATRGLVEATDLEVLVGKFVSLGVPLDDTMKLLEASTSLALKSQKEVGQAAEAMLGAMTGRMTTLAKQFGVDIEGVEATAESLSAAVKRSVGGDLIGAFVTTEQQFKTTLGNIKSNLEGFQAEQGFAATLFSDLVPGARGLMDAVRAAGDVMQDVERVSSEQAAERERRVIAHGEKLRKQNEDQFRAAQLRERAFKSLLPVQRQIAANLEKERSALSGQSEQQQRQKAIASEIAKVSRQKVETAEQEHAQQIRLNSLKSEALRIEGERLVAQQMLSAAMAAAEAARKQWTEEQEEQERKRAERRAKALEAAKERRRRDANEAAFDAAWQDLRPRDTGYVAPPLVPSGEDDPETRRAVALGHAVREYISRMNEIQRQVVDAHAMKREDAAGALDALQSALDAEALVREEHAQRLLEIEFQKDEALRAAREALEQENVQRLAAEVENAQSHMAGFVSAFGGVNERMSEGLQTGRAFVAGIGALGANFEKVKKGAPGFMGAIASATAAQVSSEKSRAAIMGSFVMADAIRAFFMPPSNGTRWEFLLMGAAAATMYGIGTAQSGPPAPKSGGGGATGSASRPEIISPAGQDLSAQGMTVNFYSNAPIITGGTQSGAHELAGIAMSAAGTGMQHSGAV